MRGLNALAALLAIFAVGSMLAEQPAAAQALSRDNFAFPEDGHLRIVVFRPDVHVGSLSAGGLDQPNVEWTQNARQFIQSALEASPDLKGSNIRFLDELSGTQAEVLGQYRALFETIGGSMLAHATKQGEILPTKLIERQVGEDKYTMRIERYSRLDWELGPGASQLRDVTGADYAMLLYTYDSYGDSGRKAAQAMGAMGCLIGLCMIMPAGVHVGFAGLVELKTGHIVWFNTDLAMGGDVRDGEGAGKRVKQLLAGFPSVPAGAASASDNWHFESDPPKVEPAVAAALGETAQSAAAVPEPAASSEIADPNPAQANPELVAGAD